MNRNDLLFSNNSGLNFDKEVKNIYQLIEEGNFTDAIAMLDNLMNVNPDYPGLGECYRTVKFWQNRNNELAELTKGKQTADFLMREWDNFKVYAEKYGISNSPAFSSAMKNIFFNASEHYRIAFKDQESTADNFDLLLNLATCFLIIEEYKKSIETLEYARSANKNDARLNSLLGEAYYQNGDTNRGLLYLKEAFFLNPSQIDLDLLKCSVIQGIKKTVAEKKPEAKDIREWIPVFGYIKGMFHARRHIYSDQIESIKREIYTLEKNLQSLSTEKINESHIIPRIINKYLWMLDYFRFQNYNYESIMDIKTRLIQLDKSVFENYFKENDISVIT